RRYEAFLAFALRHRKAVLGVVLALFLGSLLLVFGIGREFFPSVDAGQITVFVRCPSNLRLDATEERVARAERLIKETIDNGDVEQIVSEIGLDPDWSAAYTANAGQQDAVIRIQLKKERALSAQEHAVRLRHAFAAKRKPDAEGKVDPDLADLDVSF